MTRLGLRSIHRFLNRPIAAATAASVATLTGCAFSDVEKDVDRNPIVNTGAGASIIYPGQSAPGIPGGQASPGSGGTSRTGPNGESHSSGSPTPGGGNITMIGGAEVDDKRHYTVHEEPLYYKYALLPFAILAAPFVAIAEAVSPEEEEGPEIPKKRAVEAAAQPPAERPPDYETRRLDALEQELDQRNAANPGAAPQPIAAGNRGVGEPGEPWKPSIAQ